MRDLRKWLFVCIGVVAVLAFVAVAITWIDADKPAPAAATDKSSMANPAVSEIAPAGYRLADIYASLNGVAATPTWTLVTASGIAPAACKTAVPVGAQDLGTNATNWQDWEGRPLDLRTAGALTLAAPPDASVHSSLLIALGPDQATASDWAVIPLPDARRYQSGRMMVNLDSGARLLLSSDDVAATYRSATLVIEVAAPDVSQADRLAQNCEDAGLTGDVRWERPFLATITALTPNPWAEWTGAASIPYPKPTPAANGHVDDARLIPGGNTTGTVLTWTGPDAYDADWRLPQTGGASHHAITGYTLIASNVNISPGEFRPPALSPPTADTVWDFYFAAGDVLGAQVDDYLRITSANAQHSVNGRITAIGQAGDGITRYTLSTVDLTTNGVPLRLGSGYAIEVVRTALTSVNHNASLTGDGAVATPLGIADEGVAETMLKVANNPTDGYLLGYDETNGLTWTAPTNSPTSLGHYQVSGDGCLTFRGRGFSIPDDTWLVVITSFANDSGYNAISNFIPSDLLHDLPGTIPDGPAGTSLDHTTATRNNISIPGRNNLEMYIGLTTSGRLAFATSEVGYPCSVTVYRP